MTHAPASISYGTASDAASRRAAFAAAGRHSARVRWLKRSIVIVSAVSIAILATLTFFDPFGRLPKNFTVSKTTLNGSRITMEKPRLSGYRDDGKPYDLRAASGIQDIRAPSVIELSEIEAKFETAEQSAVRLIAPKGVYDSAKDSMKLEGDIRINSASGYDIRLKSADVNFKTGSVISNEALTVAMPSGAISANRLLISENGKKISFLGGVETTLRPAEAPAPEETN